MAKTGGKRVGAGRKPRVVALASSQRQSVSPPTDLTEDEAAHWARLGPLADAAQTLTVQTVPAFRQLCRYLVTDAAWSEKLAADGPTFEKVSVDGAGVEHVELKAHPLITKQLVLWQRIEQLMGRFLLAPNGRPVEASENTSANPWSKWGVGA